MMFEDAWSALSLGDTASVSDGTYEPDIVGSFPWKLWRSHNFTGTLVEKVSGDRRGMRFELPPANGAVVSYTILEGMGHEVTPT